MAVGTALPDAEYTLQCTGFHGNSDDNYDEHVIFDYAVQPTVCVITSGIFMRIYWYMDACKKFAVS